MSLLLSNYTEPAGFSSDSSFSTSSYDYSKLSSLFKSLPGDYPLYYSYNYIEETG